ncbi:MAG: N-acetylmuramoyl-L-alanine amidase [Thermoanaerobaculia bacterium]
MKRRLFPPLLAGLLLFVSGALAAQEDPSEAQATAAVVLTSSGTGNLTLSGSASPIAFGTTAQGLLVELEPVVLRLGGRLEVGPLRQSYTLAIGETNLVLVPGSPAMTSGTEIQALAQAPANVDGRLLVPLELLERSYGAQLGVTFSWDDATSVLSIVRPPQRELPLEVGIVHLQGVTTVVLQFPEAPRYRISHSEGVYEVDLVGDHLVPPPTAPKLDDPWVRKIDIAPDHIRLELAPDCAAESYTLRTPFRLVFDVFKQPPSATPVAPPVPRSSARHAIRTVVIDPGHGGKESGAIGPAGSAEKDLSLLIAKTLATRLEQVLGVRTVLTRTDDVDLGLDDRSALANQNQADLFLSIHLNSSLGRGALGAETYFLSLQASDQRAADAAAVENYVGAPAAAPGSEDFELQLLLWDLAQSQHLAASQRLATIIQGELNHDLDLRDRGVKQAPFRVLMGAAMPAVLVELGFINTREEEQRLRTPEYRSQLVETLVRAISRFKQEYETGGSAPPPGTP